MAYIMIFNLNLYLGEMTHFHL